MLKCVASAGVQRPSGGAAVIVYFQDLSTTCVQAGFAVIALILCDIVLGRELLIPG